MSTGIAIHVTESAEAPRERATNAAMTRPLVTSSAWMRSMSLIPPRRHSSKRPSCASHCWSVQRRPCVQTASVSCDGSSFARLPYKREGVSLDPHSVAPAAAGEDGRRRNVELARRVWLDAARVLGDFGTAAVVVIALLLLIVFIAGDVWGWHKVA